MMRLAALSVAMSSALLLAMTPTSAGPDGGGTEPSPSPPAFWAHDGSSDDCQVHSHLAGTEHSAPSPVVCRVGFSIYMTTQLDRCDASSCEVKVDAKADGGTFLRMDMNVAFHVGGLGAPLCAAEASFVFSIACGGNAGLTMAATPGGECATVPYLSVFFGGQKKLDVAGTELAMAAPMHALTYHEVGLCRGPDGNPYFEA